MMKKLFLLAALFITGGMAAAQPVSAPAAAATPAAAEEAAPVFDQEGIFSFHADILIHPNGMLQVTEHIKVYAAGYNIKKGIFRNIPLYRRDVHGRNVHTGIQVTEVLKNGEPEPYNESEHNGDLRIRIGDADVDLHEGAYDYRITYETRGQIGFFEGYDELYWNVTGSDWQFDIEKASASVILPPGAGMLQTACYTGPQGSTEKNCSVAYDSSRALSFHTHQRLEAGSGFTIAVGFTPGIITRPPPPTALEKLWSSLLRYKAYILAALGTLIMFGYCFFTWLKHGKDPEKPVTVPTFEPPDGLSPAAIRYIYKKKADNTGFTAAIVNMAIKKAIHIKKDSSRFTLEKGESQKPALTAEEKGIYTKLFTGRNSIKVTDSNHRAFSAAQTAYADSLKSALNLKSYYLSNTRQIVIGGLVTGLVLFGYMLAVNFGVFFMLLFLTPFLGVGGTVLLAGITSLKEGCAGVVMTLVGSIFTFIPLVFLYITLRENDVPFIAVAFIAALLAAYFWYIYLIKAPTPLGAAQASRIAGFMMYLKTAEEHRLNMLTPPEHTPQLFERLLPYAIALDLENEWGEKFEHVLVQAGYSPDWYNGEPINYHRLSSSFSAGFISSVNRAQVNPTPPSSGSGSGSSSGSSSWSSGSSGGGSSGGGGGGGGGGGW